MHRPGWIDWFVSFCPDHLGKMAMTRPGVYAYFVAIKPWNASRLDFRLVARSYWHSLHSGRRAEQTRLVRA